jgi:hypothetical protein
MLIQKQNKNPNDWCHSSRGRVLGYVKDPEFNTVYTKKNLKKMSCTTGAP